MATPAISPQQFQTPDALAASVKSKYPQYQSIPNNQLASKILTKYPQYWQHVNRENFAKENIWQSNAPKPTAVGRFMNEVAPKVVSGIAHALPTVGMMGGALAGEGAASIPGAAAGATLGKEAEEGILEHYGMAKKPSATQEAKGLGETAAAGAASELGGKIVGKVASKTVGAIAARMPERATQFISSIIKVPSSLKLPGLDREATQKEVSEAVSSVMGKAKNLHELKINIGNAIDDLTAKTEAIVDSYMPEFKEVEVSPVSHAPSAASSGYEYPNMGKSLESGQKQLTAGGKSLPAPSEIATTSGNALGEARPINPEEASTTQPSGTPTAKAFVRQGGINLKSVLRRSARQASSGLEDATKTDATKSIQASVNRIYRHARRISSDPDNMTPKEALMLRRWLRGRTQNGVKVGMQWDSNLLGMRNDIYGELNRQIGSFLTPEDESAFAANNAKVHRLIIGKDAADRQTAQTYQKTLKRFGKYFLPSFLGSTAGGGIGYAVGGKQGAYEGAAVGGALGAGAELGILGKEYLSPFSKEDEKVLARIAKENKLGRAAGKATEALAVPAVKKAVQKGSSAALMQVLEPNQ